MVVVNRLLLIIVHKIKTQPSEAHSYVSGCRSQAQINGEGCGRKGIRGKTFLPDYTNAYS